MHQKLAFAATPQTRSLLSRLRREPESIQVEDAAYLELRRQGLSDDQAREQIAKVRPHFR